ncbi:ABC transporter permease [Cupriavidus pinatubonensis]|uniref:Multidrug ABC transporter permease YbhR n=1 Tax=Cupriavidus pinatubonensis TaxID=248026 RepID=A0ABN7ZIT1_9BURK|nr:ABC transporter permease [Cupriavidus pinatubonensis]CAG9183957.1 putative multidrug ABC transporter permease YbhR [Cupriavidus pinatubonensis]
MIRLVAAIRKEFLQFLRDWLLVALVVFIYTADLIICTSALSFDVRNLKLAVYDGDRSQLSGKLVERFTASSYFGKLISVARLSELDRLLDASKADLALVIPDGFSRAAEAGRTAEVLVLLAGTNANTANAARGYAATIVGGFSRDMLLRHAAQHGITVNLPSVEPEIRIWYNPQLEFAHFMAVSMIVSAALMVGVITAAAGLVREKESGTIEQLVVTPLRSHEVIIAKAAPPFTIGMFALVPSLWIARAFGVPLAGNLSFFIIASAIALSAFLAIGFFIGTLAKNLQQALLLAFFVLFPLLFLSGTISPIESAPAVIQWLSLFSPVRYYMEIALGILLKGVGIDVLWPQLTALSGTGLVLGAWSVARLRKQFYM